MFKELRIFLTAVMFYTRIPVPHFTDYSPENLNKATRYFPLIGLLVGGIGALVFWGTRMILPVKVAVLLTMVAQIMVTGAFHEDAFADFCDGFGGGYTKERILAIMKDSRIGTYGAAGLVMMLITRFSLLSEFEVAFIPVALIVAHTVSRLVPVLLIFSSEYVSDPDKSKSKPVGQKSSKVTLFVALLFGLLPL
ncbi:MAG: adenosylcobinamide-GDP ribazoletransferase, partial [Chlorobi bacterium]|nr:adenosylcobinamide-GDP ribazoletransferase [Chlorobiota bacterium]